jgi:hypothetical protein
MRILWGLVVAVIGCGATYLVITKIGPVGEVILGPTVGLILNIIIVSSGLAITTALVCAGVKPGHRKP